MRRFRETVHVYEPGSFLVDDRALDSMGETGNGPGKEQETRSRQYE
jgi:hypothetical protein